MPVVSLPVVPSESIGDQLRALAERIESGEFGEVLTVTWVADCGAGSVEVGFAGVSPLPAAAAHISLALGMRKLELG